ncbi:hypothetical protein [Pseudomonas sp. S5D5]|uniref:hypothetical protein n=1 Tax=Pseudomonas sp. S5D5 TaxID=2083056 RepID=UPI0013004FCD|nr:hypothetical protein [Pseudomonas sp. S5D5]
MVALKAAFFERYAIQLNARIAGGSRDCLVLAVPEFRKRAEIDRSQLISIGIWLEAQGFFVRGLRPCRPAGFALWLDLLERWGIRQSKVLPQAFNEITK